VLSRCGQRKKVVAIETLAGTRCISDVSFVSEINQSLLSVGQLLEWNYSIYFKDINYTIFDPSSWEQISIKMRDTNFPLE